MKVISYRGGPTHKPVYFASVLDSLWWKPACNPEGSLRCVPTQDLHDHEYVTCLLCAELPDASDPRLFDERDPSRRR